MNYEQDMYIDHDALDVEWLRQPLLMMEYSKLLANAEKEVTRLEEKLSSITSGLDLKIRADPESYGLEKVSENGVKSVIAFSKVIEKQKEELLEAKYERKMCQGAVTSVDQKKHALEGLSKLLGLQYFAGPRVPRDLNDAVANKNRQERVDSKVKIKRRKK